MPDTQPTARERFVIAHIFIRYVLEGPYAMNGHYLTGAKLAWQCAWCGGRLEVDPANLDELLISECLSQQCRNGLECDSMKTVRIP